MKNFALTLLFAFATLLASAATYTVEQIPNVQLSDRTQCVSNPDGILSHETVDLLNRCLRTLRDSTSVEPAIVVVEAISPDDIDTFATDLFEHWGIGKSDMDNGLLILVALESRKVAFRTGYGIEGALPDISCARIIRNQIAPAFRQGNYDGGMLAAVQTVYTILTDPEVAAEYASSERDAGSGSGSSIDGFSLYLRLCVLGTIIILLSFLAKLWGLRGKSDHIKYTKLNAWKPTLHVATCVCLGMPILILLATYWLLNRWRNHARQCPNCAAKMNKVDEINDNKYLSPAQDLEEQINSVDYDVWLCEQCGETDILPYVNGSSPAIECPNCHARAAILKADRIITKPTSRSKGRGAKVYECLNCGNQHNHFYDIEPDNSDAAAFVAGMALGSMRGGRGGGGFGGPIGGGFGGGMTGGGGASGGW